MDIATFPWSEISIGMGAVILVALMVKIFANIVSKILNQLDESRKDFKTFVEKNNHQKSDMLDKHMDVAVGIKTALNQIADRLERIEKK